jgi:hypothetical protein
MSTTATPVLADLLDAIINRLGDITADLRSNLSSPALAEVRAAAKAAERAFVLLSPWGPHMEDTYHDDIMAAVEKCILETGNIPLPPDEHFVTATIERSDVEGSDEYVRVTMPGCVYLVLGETDSVDGSEGRQTTKTFYHVVGRYPQ